MTIRRSSGAPRTASATAVTLAGAILCSCDAQVTTDYPGEPLARLRGTVVMGPAAAEGPASEAAILWSSLPGGTDFRLLGVRADVEGAFPARFTMNLYAPPPDVAILPFAIGEKGLVFVTDPVKTPPVLELAFGYIIALAPGANTEDVPASEIVGTSLDSMVFYVKRNDTPPGALADLEAGGFPHHPEPGYYLTKMHPRPLEARRATADCTFGGICMEYITDRPQTDFSRGSQRAGFQRCMTLQTKPPTTCRVWAMQHPTVEQDAETNACVEAMLGRAGRDCPPDRDHEVLPGLAGGDITVLIGAKPWEL